MSAERLLALLSCGDIAVPVNFASTSTTNRILLRLGRSDLDLLAPHLAHVDLPLRRQLQAPNKAVDYIYFIEAGFASIVASGHGRSIEVGLIGREGMTGLAVVMGATSSPNSTFMQMAGRGLRILAGHARGAMEQSPTLRNIFLQYGHAFVVQTEQTALANGRNKVAERLARWILMAHDRGEGNDLALTHEFLFLAIMLGVRRAGVTVAINMLQKKGLLSVKRGVITVLNRKGLEKISNGAYGVAEVEFRRLFG
jgi:CRP-like cAMP-binding protein